MKPKQSAGAALRALRKYRAVIACAVCGSRKETTDPNAKYCSDRCRQRAKYLRHKAWLRARAGD